MESPRNPNLCEDGGYGIKVSEDQFPSISQQNLLVINMTETQIEPMMREPVYSDQLIHDWLSWRNNSMYVCGEQNLPAVINHTAAGSTRQQRSSGQHQPAADRSSANSHSRIFITANATRNPRARKREADRKYREKVKDKQKQMKFTLETLEAENETLRKEYNLLNQKFDKLKKKDEKRVEKQKQLKSNLKTLEAENESLKKELGKLREKYEEQLAENGRLKDEIIESLKEDNLLTNARSEAPSNELDQFRGEMEVLKRELASVKTCGHGQTRAGKGNNFNGGLPNVETEGPMQNPSSPVFPSVASSPATKLPSPRSNSKEDTDYVPWLQRDETKTHGSPSNLQHTRIFAPYHIK